MGRFPFVLSIILGWHTLSITAGNCFSDQSESPVPAPIGPLKPGKKCPNGPAEGDLWACEDPSIDFPTVECLTADIKTCGIIGLNNAPSIFYSFGINNNIIGRLRDQVTPLGNLYNDMLDNAYWDRAIHSRKDTFKLAIQDRGDLFSARTMEAYAATVSGDVLVYVGQRVGISGLGAFQLGKPGEINMLRTYELPTLQRNAAVTRIISVDFSNNYHQDVDWEHGQSPPGLDNPLLPASPASDEPVPPVPARFRKARRDDNTTDIGELIGLCPILADTASVTTGSLSSSPASITPPPTVPKPSCVLHEQDPDQGITQAFCLCDATATLSPLSVPPTAHQSDSCAYTTIPATGKEVVVTMASTYSKNCQGCTQIGFNAPSCTTIPKCTPPAPR